MIEIHVIFVSKMLIMGTAQIREQLHHYIDQADDRLLNLVFGLFQADKDIVVGYRADRTPITRSEYIKDLKEAEDQIDRGDYITIEDLEKESESW